MTHTIDTRSASQAGPALVVLRRLMSLAHISEREAALVLGLKEDRQVFEPGTELFSEGSPVRYARVLLSGWAARCRMLPDGRRQIFSFVLPGDVLGVTLRPEPLALWTTIALTRMVTADATALARAAVERPHEFPGLAAALYASRTLEAASVLDQVVRLGRQSAYERMAHLLLELHWRLSVVELGAGNRFPMPLTQEVLADALGLSIVHVNRTLQQLRREGLVALRGGEVELLRPGELVALAGFRAPRPAWRDRPSAWADLVPAH